MNRAQYFVPIFLLLFGVNLFSQKIVLGTNQWPGCAIWHIAKDKGYFEEYELDISLINYNSYSDNIDAFAMGEVNVIEVDLFSLLKLAIEDSNVVGVLPTTDNVGFDQLIARDSIKHIKNIRGKKVAFKTGTIGHFLLLKALSQNNMTISQISQINSDVKEASDLFYNNKVEVAVSNIYYQQHDNILYSASDYPLLNTLIVKKDFAENNREEIEKLILVWQKSLDYINENEEEAVRIMCEYLEISEETFLLTMLNITKFINPKTESYAYFSTDFGSAFETLNELTSFILREIFINPKNEENLSKYRAANFTTLLDNSYLANLGYLTLNSNDSNEFDINLDLIGIIISILIGLLTLLFWYLNFKKVKLFKEKRLKANDILKHFLMGNEVEDSLFKLKLEIAELVDKRKLKHDDVYFLNSKIKEIESFFQTSPKIISKIQNEIEEIIKDNRLTEAEYNTIKALLKNYNIKKKKKKMKKKIKKN